jgi:predicted small lipoprotein YifL
MKRRQVLAVAMALCLTGTLTACGVKEDLEKPNGKPTKKGEQDPSKPTSTLGR